MKTCFKCNIPKELDQFYKHPQMADGYLGKCIECAKEDVRLDRINNPTVRERDRERAQLPHRKQLMANGQKRRRKEHPEKNSAYLKVWRALKKGVLIRKNCFCGLYGEAHHDDYSKPLEVKWLCKKHHEERHHELGWG